MNQRVLKWEVPVDDHQHLIGPGSVLHVGHQGDPAMVFVWTAEPADHPVGPSRPAVVVGTGQTIPEDSEHIGSTVIAYNDTGPSHSFLRTLVWHVFAEVQS